MAETVRCGECGTVLLDETARTSVREPCPECGSNCRTIAIELVDYVHIHEQLEVKQKRKGYKKPIHEELTGDDFTHSTGRFSSKTRVIDRLNDRYYEYVVDQQTGDVLRHCDEKLSEHYGRGSAKTRQHSFPHDHVAVAAYFIWLNEGMPDGRDRHHWDMAIEDLRRNAGGASPKSRSDQR